MDQTGPFDIFNSMGKRVYTKYLLGQHPPSWSRWYVPWFSLSFVEPMSKPNLTINQARVCTCFAETHFPWNLPNQPLREPSSTDVRWPSTPTRGKGNPLPHLHHLIRKPTEKGHATISTPKITHPQAARTRFMPLFNTGTPNSFSPQEQPVLKRGAWIPDTKWTRDKRFRDGGLNYNIVLLRDLKWLDSYEFWPRDGRGNG